MKVSPSLFWIKKRRTNWLLDLDRNVDDHDNVFALMGRALIGSPPPRSSSERRRAGRKERAKEPYQKARHSGGPPSHPTSSSRSSPVLAINSPTVRPIPGPMLLQCISPEVIEVSDGKVDKAEEVLDSEGEESVEA